MINALALEVSVRMKKDKLEALVQPFLCFLMFLIATNAKKKDKLEIISEEKSIEKKSELKAIKRSSIEWKMLEILKHKKSSKE